MKLLDAAEDAVRRATAAGAHLDRGAVAKWFELKHKATGEERAQIAAYSEALVASAGDDAEWIEQQLLYDAMRERMQDEAFAFEPEAGPRAIGGGMVVLDEVGPPFSRGDAADGEEEQEHGGSGGLDWGLIGRETQAMMRLNPQDRSEIETEEGGDPEG